MPGLNEILDAKATFTRRSPSTKRWNAYSALKRHWEYQIGLLVRAQQFKVPLEYGYFTFVHHERNRRRDPDNFSAGPRKMILDALQKAGVLLGDGWGHVHGLSHYWTVDKIRPGIELFVTPGRCMTPDEIRLFHHESEDPWRNPQKPRNPQRETSPNPSANAKSPGCSASSESSEDSPSISTS